MSDVGHTHYCVDGQDDPTGSICRDRGRCVCRCGATRILGPFAQRTDWTAPVAVGGEDKPSTAPLSDWVGNATTWVGNATTVEKQQFARDVRPDEGGVRPQIDQFRFARYLTLGWIRRSDYRPFYELTINGDAVALKYKEVDYSDW